MSTQDYLVLFQEPVHQCVYNMLTIFSNKSTSLSYGAISDDATEHTGSMP